MKSKQKKMEYHYFLFSCRRKICVARIKQFIELTGACKSHIMLCIIG